MKQYKFILSLAFMLAVFPATVGLAATGSEGNIPQVPAENEGANTRLEFREQGEGNAINPESVVPDDSQNFFAAMSGGKLILWIVGGIFFLMALGLLIGFIKGSRRDRMVRGV